ncbi:hypothetical protein BD311DRAFT_746024 [Dichomitus squalens]|uniref:Mid2 domain-containing protein n=1 Tax=Dichomitus squalens TaxID=114155 RepID=A0A4Q9N1M4_9APHY|nr:hypothetical protein BD311DRAFT_746024 [Dichomitus squalens]
MGHHSRSHMTSIPTHVSTSKPDSTTSVAPTPFSNASLKNTTLPTSALTHSLPTSSRLSNLPVPEPSTHSTLPTIDTSPVARDPAHPPTTWSQTTPPLRTVATSTSVFTTVSTSSVVEVSTLLKSVTTTSTEPGLSESPSTAPLEASRELSGTQVAIPVGVLAGALVGVLAWFVWLKNRRRGIRRRTRGGPGLAGESSLSRASSRASSRTSSRASHTDLVQSREADAGSVHPSVYMDTFDHRIAAGQPLPPAYEDLPSRAP